MAGGDILGIGTSALLAFQQALNTTGNNITNANTPGYSRERVNLTPQPAQTSGIGSIGSGVRVDTIQRLYDDLINSRVHDATAAQVQVDTYHTAASQLDNVLGSANTSMSAAIQQFFNAVQDLSGNPSSSSNRQALLSQAGALTSNFHVFAGQLSTMMSDINKQLSNTVDQVNTLANQIADINSRIAVSADGSGGAPSDLLDQRDLLLQQLSQNVAVKTVAQSDGSLNVFVGSGQPLVVGSQAQDLTTMTNPNDPSRYEIGYQSGTKPVMISGQLTGGTLGGLLQVRSEVIAPAQNALGRIAVALAGQFNTQHRLGVDLNGNAGKDFFSIPAPEVTGRADNAGTAAVSAAIVDPGALTTSDYRLTYTGSDAYTLTRLSDNATFNINTGGSYPYTTAVIDGMTLTIGAGASAGDTFSVLPTRDAASGFGVAITSPAEIAAASPVVAAAGAANTGTGVITPGSVNSPRDTLAVTFNTPPTTFDVVDKTTGTTLATGQPYTSGAPIAYNGVSFSISDGGSAPAAGDAFTVADGVTASDGGNTGGGVIGAATVSTADPNLTDPVTITFNNPPTSFNVTGATTGLPLTNVAYTPGAAVSFNGWTVNVSGSPAAGDTFTVGPNSGAVGDNRNALALAGLQGAETMEGGTATFQDAYAQLVADVGTKTHQADLANQSQQALLNQAKQDQQSVSGVNLDEEAANMIKYQQAYQAAAKVVSMASTLFQSLLNAVG